MKKHCLLPLLMAAAVLVSGCQAAEAADATGQTALVTPSDMFTDRDLEVGYDETTAAAITLSGSTASCDSDAVTIDGGTITITDEGTYILSGTLDDGMVIVDAEETDKIQLVLDNASIHCADCAALYVRQADKVFVTTAADSQNTLSGGETFAQLDDNNIDGVIFSKADLTLNGLGTLTVDSPAGHGVVTKDGSADSALDYNGNASITGGTLIGTGSSGMAQNFGDTSTQGAILLNVDAQAAGSTVSVSDSAGNVLASWEAPQAFSSVVISCPGLEADGTYTVAAGTSSTEVTLDGLLYGSGGMNHGMGGNRGSRSEPTQGTASAAS